MGAESEMEESSEYLNIEIPAQLKTNIHTQPENMPNGKPEEPLYKNQEVDEQKKVDPEETTENVLKSSDVDGNTIDEVSRAAIKAQLLSRGTKTKTSSKGETRRLYYNSN